MKIEIDKYSGFCFGVVYAIQMAEDELKQSNSLLCLIVNPLILPSMGDMVWLFGVVSNFKGSFEIYFNTLNWFNTFFQL